MVYLGASVSLERRKSRSRPLFGSNLQSESSDDDWLDDFRGPQLQMARAGSRDKPYDEPGNYRGYWLNTGVGASVKISSHWVLEGSVGFAPGYYEGMGASDELYQKDGDYYRKKGKYEFTLVVSVVPFRVGYRF